MSEGLLIVLAAVLFIGTIAVMLVVHFWIMNSRRSKGTPLLRVSTGLTFGTRFALSVPAGVREVDFFLSYRRRGRGGEDIVLRVRGPLSREFTFRIRPAAWAEYREVLTGAVPGQYEVELVGDSPMEFIELFAAGHPAVTPARA